MDVMPFEWFYQDITLQNCFIQWITPLEFNVLELSHLITLAESDTRQKVWDNQWEFLVEILSFIMRFYSLKK